MSGAHMRSAALHLSLVILVALPLAAATARRLDGDPKAGAVRGGATVTLDVKDAEAVAILKDMQKQCGVKNLMIDPDVNGKGTFYFRDVPCRQAWGIVLRSLGYEAVTYQNSVVTVGTKRPR